MRVVVDGKVGRKWDWVFDGSITFSPDGKRMAFAAKRFGAALVVVDNTSGPPYDGIGSIAFSPDSKRIAYGAQRGEAWCVVVDGIPGRDYDWLAAGPSFSPDSRHVIYVADRLMQSHPKQEFIVLDDVEGQPYQWVRGLPRFSPDSSRLAYIAAAADPRFDSGDEVPSAAGNPAAGAKVVFDKSVGYAGIDSKERAKPIDLRVVEERLVPE
jgi:hypothetical protein